jgi:cell division GTPase FtsZ
LLVCSLEVCEFNLQNVLVVVAGGEDLSMIDANVLALKTVEEELEGVLEVRVGTLNLVV